MTDHVTANTDEAILNRGHDDHLPYSRPTARKVAQRLRAQGIAVSPFQCHVCPHWHIGHTPSMETVEKMAAAIRRRTAGLGPA